MREPERPPSQRNPIEQGPESERRFSVEKPKPNTTAIDFTSSSGPNIWTEAHLDEFVNEISHLKDLPEEHTVVFLMGDHFGADVNFFKGASQGEFYFFIDKINKAFDTVAALRCNTVAVMGHCYGGGYELALSCDKRIGIQGENTRIGLTETKFGLFPGAGGTQRLPRLIGDQAIDMIVNGETVSTIEALERGMIDQVISPEQNPISEAVRLSNRTIERKEPDFSHVQDIVDRVQNSVDKTLESHKIAAINSIIAGLRVSLEAGLYIERAIFHSHCPSDIMHEKIARFKTRGMEDPEFISLI